MEVRRKFSWLCVAAALVFAGCTSGDDDAVETSSEDPTTTAAGADAGDATTTAPPSDADTGDATTTSAGEATTTVGDTTTTVEVTGPSPGVTDDTIKIGITYVDTEALAAANLILELGDHEAVYQALIDDINANGGIHGRTLEAFFAPINPSAVQPAEEACLRLTEDEDVFLLTGFFLGDNVLCPLDIYETAVVGGTMTPQRLDRARAPWITWDPDTDQPKTVVRRFFENGDLDGSLAVFAHANDAEILEEHVLPTLAELGVEPVEVSVIDAPTDDTAALQADVLLSSELFQSAGADTILLVGQTSANWLTYTNDDPSYRPLLRFLEITAAQSFVTNAATTDTAILEGSLAGGDFGPNQAKYDEDSMQECIAILTAAGLDTPSPSEFAPDERVQQPYQAAFQACPDIFLIRALLEAAGENLNYGTLTLAIDGLEVAIPGDPTPRTFGPPPSADGDPSAYIFRWDPAANDFALVED